MTKETGNIIYHLSDDIQVYYMYKISGLSGEKKCNIISHNNKKNVPYTYSTAYVRKLSQSNLSTSRCSGNCANVRDERNPDRR